MFYAYGALGRVGHDAGPRRQELGAAQPPGVDSHLLQQTVRPQREGVGAVLGVAKRVRHGGGLTAGNAADYILSRYTNEGGGGDDEKIDEDDMLEKRTREGKLFQSMALLGPAACLYLLSGLPERASTAQFLLGGAVGLQAFDAAGFGAATQEKAGERWAGLLYSETSLPGVMVGSVSVSVTGRLLDRMAGDEGSGWATVYQLDAAICVAGALAFLLFYNSKKEFE